MTFTFHPSVPRGIVTGITILTVVSLLIYLIQQYKPLKPIATWHFGGEDVFQPLSYIPPTGLGTWQIPKSKAVNIVKFALETGYRHIDAALIYGQCAYKGALDQFIRDQFIRFSLSLELILNIGNEKQVGEGIAAARIPRSSLWVTGKLWNNAHRPSAVRPALEQTLHNLGLDYLDLYLMHWPVAFEPGSVYNTVIDHDTDLRETWSAMEDLVREGLVRQIGISNFDKAQTETILRHATIPPTVHEFECHLYLQQPEFVKWTLNHGMRVIAYSPLGNMNSIYNSSLLPLLQDPSLLALAERKGLTVAQLALAWNMHRGVIVIPKSEHTERVVENFHAQSVHLTAEDMEFLNGLDRKARFNNPSDDWNFPLYSGLDGV
ncbi:hypothetical protein AFGD_005406 [Aspergillus flavus]|nr:hypothetical protein AFGD_005406 [Aspergillus flavus]